MASDSDMMQEVMELEVLSHSLLEAEQKLANSMAKLVRAKARREAAQRARKDLGELQQIHSSRLERINTLLVLQNRHGKHAGDAAGDLLTGFTSASNTRQEGIPLHNNRIQGSKPAINQGVVERASNLPENSSSGQMPPDHSFRSISPPLAPTATSNKFVKKPVASKSEHNNNAAHTSAAAHLPSTTEAPAAAKSPTSPQKAVPARKTMAAKESAAAVKSTATVSGTTTSTTGKSGAAASAAGGTAIAKAAASSGTKTTAGKSAKQSAAGSQVASTANAAAGDTNSPSAQASATKAVATAKTKAKPTPPAKTSPVKAQTAQQAGQKKPVGTAKTTGLDPANAADAKNVNTPSVDGPAQTAQQAGQKKPVGTAKTTGANAADAKNVITSSVDAQMSASTASADSRKRSAADTDAGLVLVPGNNKYA
jgi:hypothetical protein